MRPAKCDIWWQTRSRKINSLTPRRLFLACTWVDVEGDMEPRGELIFLKEGGTGRFGQYPHSKVLQRYSQTWTTSEEGNTSGPNDLPILICALLLHFNSFIQLAVRGAKIVIPLHFDSCAVVPSVRQLCEPNSLLPRFARSASVWSAQLSHGVISTVLSGNGGGDPRQISQSQSCLGFERQQLAQAHLRALWGLGES